MAEFHWPDDFDRVPDAPWTDRPVAELAEGYDTVEEHGWYANLDPTVDAVAGFVDDGDLVADYSGGTGIFAKRLLGTVGDRSLGVVIVDSSPKFLRLALEKLADEPRAALRRIDVLDDQQRLQYLDEVLDALVGDIDAVVSTNAIHLYHDLEATLAAWRRSLADGGRVFVSSGNVRRDEVPTDRWIIDETVDAIDQAARAIVLGDDRWTRYRAVLDDEERMADYRALKERIFPPVRGLDHYVDAFEAAGLEVVDVTHRPIEAEVDEWYEFLSVYHEGVLPWVGGSERVDGEPPDDRAVDDRLELIGQALDRVFGDAATFVAEWTYLTCEPA